VLRALTKHYSVLFLCTGNSARSILAEAYLNAIGAGRFKAYSAGSRPTGKINPFALDLLEKKGIDASSLRSKSWEEFARPGAPPIDLVLTVCDSAATETCPVWPQTAIEAHWGIADPAAVTGSDESKRRAFEHAFAALCARIERLVELPIDRLDCAALKSMLDKIGKLGAVG
jgi:protein-tyrosine-phosphatase